MGSTTVAVENAIRRAVEWYVEHGYGPTNRGMVNSAVGLASWRERAYEKTEIDAKRR